MAKSYVVSARLEAKDNASPKIRGMRDSVSSLASSIKDRLVVTFGDLQRAVTSAVDFMRGFITAAIEGEDATARLEASLARLGPAASSVTKELTAQAAALQKTTRFSDEQVMSAQALIATMGASATEIPLATQAAVELAAALKIDLDSAAKQVGKTLNGVVSRDLRAVIPALANLDKASLKSGGALRVILDQLSGRAAADAKTTSGAIAQLGNAFDELRQAVGDAIIKNDEFKKTLSDLREAATDPATVDAFAAIGTEFARFISDATNREKGIPKLVSQLGEFRDFLSGLASFLPESVTGDEPIFDLPKAFKGFADFMSGGNAEAIFGGLSSIAGDIRDIGAAQREQADATRELGAAAGSAATQIDALNAANERTTRIQAEQSAAQTEFLDSLKAAGITITDNEAAQKRQEDVSRQADLAYRDGRISIDAYNQVVDQAKQKIAALNVTLASQPARLDATTSALKRQAAAYVEAGNAANYLAAAAGQQRFGGATASERNRASITFASPSRRVDVAG